MPVRHMQLLAMTRGGWWRSSPAGTCKESFLCSLDTQLCSTGIRQVGMASGLVAQQPTSDRDDPNPLSGSLDLGKNGITQVNGYEQFKAR